MEVTIIQIFCSIFLLMLSSGAQKQPKIYTKDGNVHIRSGDKGNIIFEPSQEGKVLVGTNELNMTTSVGPKGEQGEKGNNGTSGPRGGKGEKGAKSEKGEKGEIGLQGDKGERGPQGLNGTTGPAGQKGDIGLTGSPGTKGDVGPPGLNGSRGSQGPNGTQGQQGEKGSSGVKGEKGDTGYTPYIVQPKTQTICNTSSLGTLRYFSNKLQLCTPKGWKSVAFEHSETPLCQGIVNVPETNLEAFYAAECGIMFQFNKDTSAIVNFRTSFNITTDILPVNTTLNYQKSTMRQSAHFPGKPYLNVSGLPENFWRDYNWSIMALMKFGVPDGGKHEIPVLGHGKERNNEGFHVGVSHKSPIIGYYNNDLKVTQTFVNNKWYHITWTSQKLSGGEEKRCVNVDGNDIQCDTNKNLYQGSGDTTIGTWWNRDGLNNNLDLDQLIIISGIVRYKTYTAKYDKQLCYAKLVDEKLP